jgi:probable F420-dependent oxidoreductase
MEHGKLASYLVQDTWGKGHMKLSVEFPSIAYREGPEGVKKLAAAIEEIGFDQLDMFDHVLMGFPTETRTAPMYPPKMPIIEALMMLSFAAAVTNKIGLGTEVLVLPQRQPTLVAKQIATLDTLSGGRVRLGVGVGWQESEYDALGETFSNRGKRMDEAVQILRSYWGDEQIDFAGEHYEIEAMAMEPKPPQGAKLPIWIGGNVPRALQRVGELGDGWLATAIEDVSVASRCIEKIHAFAETAGRDPSQIGMQMMLDVPPRDEAGKDFYKDPDNVVRRAAQVRDAGFEWGALNATAMFQAGYRSVDQLIDQLSLLHDRMRAEIG